jgi:hypothetical protein
MNATLSSIIIQYREDDPNNNGWWRYSRPRHQYVVNLPRIDESTRWTYASEGELSYHTDMWDRQHPNG